MTNGGSCKCEDSLLGRVKKRYSGRLATHLRDERCPDICLGKEVEGVKMVQEIRILEGVHRPHKVTKPASLGGLNAAGEWYADHDWS